MKKYTKTLESTDSKEPQIKRLGRMETNSGITTIYVGNLNYEKSEFDLKKIFVEYGPVRYVEVSNKIRGVAFIQMKSKENALKAIKGLNGTQLDGRTLKVSIAKERTPYVPTIEPKKIKTTSAVKKGSREPEIEEVVRPRRRDKERGLNTLLNYLNKPN